MGLGSGKVSTPPTMKKTTTVIVDDRLLDACRPFDYKFDGTSVFDVPEFNAPKRDGTWAIGLIVGPSGSGKTTILKQHFGITDQFEWDHTKAIASQVDFQKLMAVGLNSVPSWCRPFHVLSNGESFRANLAARLTDNTSFDEFTSVVDRNVAKSCSNAVHRYIKSNGIKGVVFSSCHYDIIEWLKPDWVFDLQKGQVIQQGFFRQPVVIRVERCDKALWKVFRQHHYLDGNMNNSAECFSAYWDSNLVGFCSVLAFPNGNFKNAFREHRTVVLPDFQGLGIGVKLSDVVAKHYVTNGCRFFSKTAHPRMGEYRERSKNWKPTSKNRKNRSDYKSTNSFKKITKESSYCHLHENRICYSHEYILNEATK